MDNNAKDFGIDPEYSTIGTLATAMALTFLPTRNKWRWGSLFIQK